MRRVELPPGGSTLTTSAPRPASVSPQYSACSSASSMTRMPVRGPMAANISCPGDVLVPAGLQDREGGLAAQDVLLGCTPASDADGADDGDAVENHETTRH